MHPQRRAGVRIAFLVLAVTVSTILASGLSGVHDRGTVIVSIGTNSIAQSYSVEHSLPLPSPGAVAAPVAAGFQWTDISPAHMPPPRLSGGMVFDSQDGYVLLFGGQSNSAGPLIWQNDTWTFSGGVWTNVTNPADAPSGRLGAGLADDPADHEVVLFGGSSYRTSWLNDTWTYSGGVWTNVSPVHSPPRMFWASMAYDNQTGSVLLFGGNTGGAPSQAYTNQTWEFHANTWTNVTTVVAPPGRDGATMVYDGADGKMLLFGGLGVSDYFNDTWTYSGGTWSPVSTSGAPDARSGPGMAYDPALSKVVVFGGSPTADSSTTYTYVAGTWAAYNLVPTPPQTTTWGQMTYDYADHYLVLFDESTSTYTNSTWKLNLTSGVPPPPLKVTANAQPQSGPIPLQVAFSSDVSGGTPPYTVSWDFDDSTANSAAGNISHTYANAGKYNATLTVTDHAANTVVQNWTITATPPPLTLTISASPTSARVNQTVSFTPTPGGGTPPYTYAWSFGDGGTSALQSPTRAYAAVGQYTAQLVLHDSAGASITRTVSVTVSAGPSSSSSTSSWWIYAIVVVVVVILALLIVLRLRRRKQQALSALPVPPTPPPGPPSG